MTDNRRSVRAKTYLGGAIIFNSSCSKMDCVVRNLSDTGALVEIDQFSDAPAQFQFELPSKNRAFQAKVAWHSARRAGLIFLDEADRQLDSIPVDWARRFKQEKLEKQRLMRQIEDLRSA